ncbi:MAG: 30S ribosomal protein S18 [Candidatus Kapabacteria bacterium]|jgi:small subunit ribosomal protein S18|nr:30S ribosomal protein S18 [Candidatus Kapabacteria bacterium]
MNAIHPMQTGNTFKPNKKTGKKKQNPLKDQRFVDYLDAKFLSRFTNDQGKILPKRITGVSAYQQRLVAQAVKYARHLALMPFVAQDVN